MTTVETGHWQVKIDDEKIDQLMEAYHEAVMHAIRSNFDADALNAKLALENALVAMGLLEDEPEDADEQDEPWDEDKAREEAYLDMIDHKVDEMRDMALMGLK